MRGAATAITCCRCICCRQVLVRWRLADNALRQRQREQLLDAPEQVAQTLALQLQRRLAQHRAGRQQFLQPRTRQGQQRGRRLRLDVQILRLAVEQPDVAPPAPRPDDVEAERAAVRQLRAQAERTGGDAVPLDGRVAETRQHLPGRQPPYVATSEDLAAQRFRQAAEPAVAVQVRLLRGQQPWLAAGEDGARSSQFNAGVSRRRRGRADGRDSRRRRRP
jgi:hypothetical protein